MDKIEEKIQEIVSKELTTHKSYSRTIDSTIRKLEDKKYYYKKLKLSFATICCSLIFVTGIAFAKDIETFFKENFNLGKGITRAVENDYISIAEMNYVNSDAMITQNSTILENINTEVKIDNFLMDNNNLSIEFYLKFDKEINNYVKNQYLYDIYLSDLIILDEENRLIYTSSAINEEQFNNFCKNNNLNYEYQNFNENYLNCGLNAFISKNNNSDNSICLIYNMYTQEYPCSKKLHFYFKEITFKSKDSNLLKDITLTGNWNLDIDVPEKFYNRQSIVYKVKSCSNDNYKVINAVVYETGMELYMEGKIEPRAEDPMKKIEEDSKKNNDSKEVFDKKLQIFNKSDEYQNWWKKTNLFPIDLNNLPFVENSKGDKFEESLSPSTIKGWEYFDDGTVTYHNTFTLTKYDATNTLTVNLKYRDGDIIIRLER